MPAAHSPAAKRPGTRGHLRVAVDADAAHDVMRRRADLHRLGGDVDVGQLLELVIHARQLFLDVLGRVGDLFLDPGNIEKHAAVRAAAAGLHLAHDAAGDVIARQQLRRAAGVFVALRVAPAFFFVVGGLASVVFGDVVEHEAPAVFVPQHAAFAANAFGDQNSAHAGRPDHAGRMELDELHVDQFRAGVIGQGVAVAGAFPTVAGDLVSPADAAGGEHDRLGVEELEAAVLALVAERADDAIAVLEQRDDGAFHVDVDALMDAVVLQACGSFPDRCDRRRGRAADSDGRRNFAAEFGHPWCDRRPRPRLPVRARGPALPWRAARPCASC